MNCYMELDDKLRQVITDSLNFLFWLTEYCGIFGKESTKFHNSEVPQHL